MREVNWKILNLAFWIELILAYILPFKVIDDFEYKIGLPITFISLYDTEFGITPFDSMAFNPIGLLFNVIIIYLIITWGVRGWLKLKNNRAK